MKKQLVFICTMVAVIIGATLTMTQVSCNKDACSGIVCKHGGTCATGTCSCPAGYTGTRCDTAYSKQFVGAYLGQITSSNPLVPNTYIIAADSANGGYAITIEDSVNQVTFNGTIQTNNTINIPNQAVIHGDSVLNASGSFTLPSITVTYSLKAGSSYTTTFSGRK